ncbi:glycine betaine/proline transport system substrate-binding protein [Streptomonospora nanhaiensis]|uniref:Glycine betaine/proline transport system substrate-binding protein n=1 Tax=Streptomonospora nanhaiensis TaxID=1323731 RepID=A0A853BNB9_9ACTN|nr:ABC transporter substrate-binding protein [Streptomonospora nanhaiensis]NYI96693.1 glycine betaine/proline transport system substrate-binding protein [Streptomonospora nanhaiensis]
MPDTPAARTPRSLPALPLRVLAVLLAAALLSSCAVRTTSMLRDPNTVRIALNGWVGYEASAAVLAYLLEHELDYQTQLVRIDEQPAWQAMDQGAVDVIVENWGHDDLMELYGPGGNGTVVDGGPTGNKGTLGWYVPRYLVEEYPGIDTVEGVREHAEIFATAETGDKGQFLAGDPGFVTQDQGMINHFGLDLEIVYAGSEAAQITEVRERYADREPVLFYFYEPQWLFEELDLVHVEFPPYREGCDSDLADVACDYPAYDLNKIFRAGFAEDGGPAYELLDNWRWTNADQNAVARMIADEGMDPDDAAQRWVRANPDTWRPWLPEGERG